MLALGKVTRHNRTTGPRSSFFGCLGMLRLVRVHFPDLAAFAEWCYGEPSRLLCQGHVVLSEAGVQQGDCFGPLFFAVALHPEHWKLCAFGQCYVARAWCTWTTQGMHSRYAVVQVDSKKIEKFWAKRAFPFFKIFRASFNVMWNQESLGAQESLFFGVPVRGSTIVSGLQEVALRATNLKRKPRRMFTWPVAEACRAVPASKCAKTKASAFRTTRGCRSVKSDTWALSMYLAN